MPGKLLVSRGAVKRVPSIMPHLGLSVLLWSYGCGGAPQEVRPVDPYQPRVANCIGVARNASDAAQQAMVPIPAGAALLGSTEAERAQARRDFGPGGEQRFQDERSAQRVKLHGFRIDPTAVTNQAYAEFVDACGVLPPDEETITQQAWERQRSQYGLPGDYTHVQIFLWPGRTPARGRERHPMVLVTQDKAAFYCAWRGARLPTEDEWERAARGPGGYIYPWGNRYDPFRVYSAARKSVDTRDVGELGVGDTPEGLHGMGGHVFEWTSTPYPGGAGAFIAKGNGFGMPGGYGRGAARVPRAADIRDIRLGFRCAAN